MIIFDNHQLDQSSYQTQSGARLPSFGWQQVVYLFLIIWCQEMTEECHLQIKIAHFPFGFWGADLEPCSFQVSYALAVSLSWTFSWILCSSTEGGPAIGSHQSRLFLSERLWVGERFLPSCVWESTAVHERQLGQVPGPPSL